MDVLVRKRIVAAVLFVLLLFACGFQNAGELECEEAVSHLVECCPGFRSSELRCIRESGCGSRTEPALDEGESKCLKEKGCDELIARGFCKRAQAARGATVITDDTHSTYDQKKYLSGQEAVCP